MLIKCKCLANCIAYLNFLKECSLKSHFSPDCKISEAAIICHPSKLFKEEELLSQLIFPAERPKNESAGRG